MDLNRIIQALKGTIDPKLRIAAENELNQVREGPCKAVRFCLPLPLLAGLSTPSPCRPPPPLPPPPGLPLPLQACTLPCTPPPKSLLLFPCSSSPPPRVSTPPSIFFWTTSPRIYPPPSSSNSHPSPAAWGFPVFSPPILVSPICECPQIDMCINVSMHMGVLTLGTGLGGMTRVSSGPGPLRVWWDPPYRGLQSVAHWGWGMVVGWYWGHSRGCRKDYGRVQSVLRVHRP